MKVFHIVPSLVKGSGVTEMLYQIHKDCYSKNIQNFFLLWDKNETYNLKNRIILKKNLNFFFIFFFYFKFIRSLSKEKEEIFFVQHGLWHPIYIYTYLILRICNFKYSVVLHGMLMSEAFKYKRLKKRIALSLYQKKILINAKNIILTNKYEKEKSFKLLNKFCNNFKVINVGTKITNKIINKKLSKKIVSFSRIHPIKSFEDFINNWDKKKLSYWTWEIYGPIDDQKYYNNLIYLLKKHSLNNQIFIKKPVYNKKRKIKIFKESSFLLQTSKSESFNFSISESLSLAVPVIVTKNSPWQIVHDKKLGYLYDNSTKSIKNVINNLSKLDNNQYAKFIYNFKRVTTSFSWDTFIKKIVY